MRLNRQRLIFAIAAASGCFFLLVGAFLAWNLPQQDHSFYQHHYGSHRLGVVIPFVGKSIAKVPTYLNLFCRGARAASDVADFFLIHNGILNEVADELQFCHSNVIIIDLQSTRAIAERMLRVLDHKEEATWELPRSTLIAIMTAHLRLYPYALVEYKPAYGHIFQDFLKDYTHWAYADYDIVFGDLGRHIEEREWNDFDVVTYGFGDQQRIYVKGQFTMHKNTELGRQLWKGCEYLSDLDKRLDGLVNHQKEFKLESAEGCYPSMLMQNHNISVKFAVKSWTDVVEIDTAYTQGIYMFQNPRYPHKHVLAKALPGETNNFRLLNLPQDWFFQDSVYNDRKRPLQVPVGAMEPLELPNNEDANCMHWVQSKYQKHLCLDEEEVSDSFNVYWVRGKLYKQAFVNTELKSKVATGPFFHFQDWKRRFRNSEIAVLEDTRAAVSVLTQQGGIVVAESSTSANKNRNKHPPPSPLGIHMESWRAMKDTHGAEEDRSQLPTKSYCLSGEPDRHQFRLFCGLMVSWKKDTQILSKAKSWDQFSTKTDVTLVQTLQIHSQSGTQVTRLLHTIGENLRRWKGQPSVVVVYVSPFSAGAAERVKHFVSTLTENVETCLFGMLAPPRNDEDEADSLVSQKSLENMVIDMVPTRWYISGLHDGDAIISPDTVNLARQKAYTHQSLPGNMFLLPQFAFSDQHWWNLTELVQAKTKHHVRMPSDFDDCGEEENDKNEIVEGATSLWWQQTLDMLDGTKQSDKTPSTLAESLQEIEYKLVNGLRTEDGLISLPYSPVLLMDNVVGGSGQPLLHSHALARHVEEFGGSRCFNLLRLAQLVLFGFELNVLEGAFVASDKASREGARYEIGEKAQKCHGCFMVESSNEMRDKIFEHEVTRSTIAGTLWEQQRRQATKL